MKLHYTDCSYANLYSLICDLAESVNLPDLVPIRGFRGFYWKWEAIEINLKDSVRINLPMACFRKIIFRKRKVGGTK